MRVFKGSLVDDLLSIENGHIGFLSLSQETPIADAQFFRIERGHLPDGVFQG